MKQVHTEPVPTRGLSSMSTAALRELLFRELEAHTAAEMNVDLIQEITGILDARAGIPAVDTAGSYDDFTSNHLYGDLLYPAEEFDGADAPAPRRSKRFLRLGLLAAALVILLAGITVTAQASSLWKALASWTEETFQLDLGVSPAAPSLEELHEILVQENVPAPLVCRYLPQGYEFVSSQTGYGQIHAIYENRDSVLIIQVHSIASGNASKLEKDDADPIVYTVHGIDHYIVSNLGLYSATWVSEGYECTVTGIPSLEEAYKMIDSVY